MLKYADYDIVFQEIPNEVTLAINISNCPNRCVGCHSPYLMEDVGEELNETSLDALIEKYGKDVTCICFMGGDADHKSVASLAHYIKEKYQPLKVGWYSGKPNLPESFPLADFDYIKVGPYREDCGPLNSRTTNQRLYSIFNGELMDITSKFWRK
ncbi:MAG: anaerobic ribonucleoside-triphosphate reductase activating protein [Paludibacteraceae bacterium]|nr:anaerobic ribonucleoside-triphosphate reductase activating protein [Paludibacteraceae bacterium]MBO7636036.1 anaerobic ribonucleoside-triphosphate reductase activating protein [Paludibacteraceae bacterium]MBR5972772.1 anaerobic ribonucleoside-triphosphate reductase activating protein [Paludibacteraceae bacterium]